MPWNDLIYSVDIFTSEYKYQLFGENISWFLVEQYPSCQLLDLHDYFEMATIVPQEIIFQFNTLDFISVNLLIEERNMVTSRSLKYSRLMNTGPPMTLNDLGKDSFDFF